MDRAGVDVPGAHRAAEGAVREARLGGAAVAAGVGAGVQGADGDGGAVHLRAVPAVLRAVGGPVAAREPDPRDGDRLRREAPAAGPPRQRARGLRRRPAPPGDGRLPLPRRPHLLRARLERREQDRPEAP